MLFELNHTDLSCVNTVAFHPHILQGGDSFRDLLGIHQITGSSIILLPLNLKKICLGKKGKAKERGQRWGWNFGHRVQRKEQSDRGRLFLNQSHGRGCNIQAESRNNSLLINAGCIQVLPPPRPTEFVRKRGKTLNMLLESQRCLNHCRFMPWPKTVQMRQSSQDKFPPSTLCHICLF